MSLIDLLADPELKSRYLKVKRYFYLRESAYDVTSACQLRCQGCYYFSGTKYAVKDTRDPGTWKRHLAEEKCRGINYVNLAGAEPSLVPDILRACYETIPMGTVFTNGLIPIDKYVGYRIHISLWGGNAGDPVFRPFASGRATPPHLGKQLENYRDDMRAIFVYTFNQRNVEEAEQVVQAIKEAGHRITFNVFSPPKGYREVPAGNGWLSDVRRTMLRLLRSYPETVLYSQYAAKVHTAEQSLRVQFGCPYPRALEAGTAPLGIGVSFRSYRADLTHYIGSDCCVPDTDCSACRHYAAGSAIVTHRLDMHAYSEELFRGWLDYVDTYLAVWIMGYPRDRNLFDSSNDN